MDIYTLALSIAYANKTGKQIMKKTNFKTKVENDRSILNTVGEENTFYFLPKTVSKPSNGYDEYIYLNNKWELMGETDVNLSEAMALTPINPTSEEINSIPAGQLYSDTVNHKGIIKGGQEFYDTEYLDEAIPTKVSDLTNDSDFVTKTEIEPVIDKSDNIFYFTNTTNRTVGGLTLEFLSNSSVKVNGTSTNYVYLGIMGGTRDGVGTFRNSEESYSGVYSLKLVESGGIDPSGNGGTVRYGGVGETGTLLNKGESVTLNDQYFSFRFINNKTYTDYIVEVMLTPTEEPEEFRPYNEVFSAVDHVARDNIAQINLSQYAKKSELPVKVSDLTNDSGFISAEQEIGYLISENKKEYLSNKPDVKWNSESISSSTGKTMESTTRCSTDYVTFDDAVAIQISVKTGYKVAIAAYDEDGSKTTYAGLIRNFSNEQATYKITNKKYKFIVAYDDDKAITTGDIPVDCITVVYYARSKNIAEKEIAMATCFEPLIADTQNESLTWGQGNVSISNGDNQSSVLNRCHTGFILAKRGKLSITIGDGYMFGIRFYTSNDTSSYTHNYIGWIADDYQQTITENCYIKLVIRKQDNSNIAPADITSDALILSQSIYQDDTLTAENLPAQAKAVGEAISAVKNYEIYDSMIENYEWVQGGFWANGSDVASTSSRYSKACRSKYFFFGDATLKIKPKDGYQFDVIRYYRPPFTDSMYDGISRIRDSLGGLIDKEITLKTDFNYIRFSVGKSDGSDITPDTIPLDCLDIKITKSDVNLPDIYNAYLFDKIQSVNDNVGAVGKNGETFIFITDLHWDSGNTKKSPMIVKRILDKTPLNTIICGGDLINNGTDKEAEKRKINDCIKQFYDPRATFPIAFGNHDANSNGQTEYPERHFSRNEIFALMMKQVSNDVTYLNDVDWSFTYDRPGTKTRFLFIDTGRTGAKGEESGYISLSARQSIYNALNNVPAGYHVIVVAHLLYSITNSAFTDFGSELVSVLEAYNARSSIVLDGETYDYVNANGECKCIMIGHSHDNAQGVTENGIPWILTDSDNLQRSHNFDDKQYRHQNTTTEQCFDVVSIDYNTGDIHIVRFGAGADRDFSVSTKTWSSSNNNIILVESQDDNTNAG